MLTSFGFGGKQITLACEKPTSVLRCPSTKKEWDAAASRKGCFRQDCLAEAFHCVPDDKGNLVEVCARPKVFNGKYNRLHMQKIFNSTLTLYMARMNSK